MAFSMNPNLEARLREIAQQQGRDVQSVIDEALKAFADAATRSNGAGKPNGVGPINQHADFMRRLRQRQQARGMQPSSAGEIANQLRHERDSWDD